MTLDTLEDIRDAVGLKGQWDDTDYTLTINAAIQEAYRRVIDRYVWPEISGVTSVTAVGQDTSLPSEVSTIRRIQSSDGQELRGCTLEELSDRYGAGTSVTPSAVEAYALLGSRSVHTEFSTTGSVRIVSTSNEDIGETVRVEGWSSSAYLRENITLNGTTKVDGANTYSDIIRVAKSARTTGQIQILNASDDSVIGVIHPSQKTVDYQWIRFNRATTSTYTVYFNRYVPDLTDNNDSPVLPGVGHILVAGAYAEVLKAQRQFEKAAYQEREFFRELEYYYGRRIGQDIAMQFTPDERWTLTRRESAS